MAACLRCGHSLPLDNGLCLVCGLEERDEIRARVDVLASARDELVEAAMAEHALEKRFGKAALHNDESMHSLSRDLDEARKARRAAAAKVEGLSNKEKE